MQNEEQNMSSKNQEKLNSKLSLKIGAKSGFQICKIHAGWETYKSPRKLERNSKRTIADFLIRRKMVTSQVPLLLTDMPRSNSTGWQGEAYSRLTGRTAGP